MLDPAPAGETLVGADSTLLGAGTWLQMAEELQAGGLTLVDVGINLIDQVWADKPESIVSLSGGYLYSMQPLSQITDNHD